MVLGIVFAIAVLISGIALLTFASDKAVEHSVHFASALGISSLMIGLMLVSIGTDLPEIANSIVACSSGEGNIDVGDSIGSILTQMTLILGLITFLGRKFNVKRKEVLVIGVFQVLALVLAIFVALSGFTRLKAFLLIVSWPVFLFIIKKMTSRTVVKRKEANSQRHEHYLFHFVIAAVSYIGVAIGAVAVVQSVIMLSDGLGIPKFFISFFVLAIGTSLPELVVDLTAIRKRQYELAIGDIIGSCIVDATVSISIGQLLFPTEVFYESPAHSIPLALYAVIASVVVISALTVRGKVDRKAGVLFIIVYSVAYILLYVI